MKRIQKKNNTRIRRAHSVRGHLKSGSTAPRLSVFRSNANLYVQVIDDSVSKTLASARLSEVKADKSKVPSAQVDRSHSLGKLIGERALKAGIKAVVFDRGRYAYHGRVKAVAEGAREAGLKF
jgi:large subunit ribosomal protein L18